MEEKGFNDGELSKREQEKLERAIKLMEQNEKKQEKHKKRRAHAHAHNIACQPKQIKKESEEEEEQRKVKSQSEEEKQEDKVEKLPHHLNNRYQKLKDKNHLTDYLQAYSQLMAKKIIEKKQIDLQQSAQINQQILIKSKTTSLQFCLKIDQQFKEGKQRLRDPLSRAYRQFSTRMLNDV